MRLLKIALILTGAITLAGCAEDTPRVDANLGRAVKEMIQAQTYDPRAAANPPAFAPEGADGERLKNVLDAHRKDIPKGEERVARPLVFEVGGAPTQ